MGQGCFHWWAQQDRGTCTGSHGTWQICECWTLLLGPLQHVVYTTITSKQKDKTRCVWKSNLVPVAPVYMSRNFCKSEISQPEFWREREKHAVCTRIHSDQSGSLAAPPPSDSASVDWPGSGYPFTHISCLLVNQLRIKFKMDNVPNKGKKNTQLKR